MDGMRGHFIDRLEVDTSDDYPSSDRIDPPARPAEIGQDERRMQVRAYNFWASLLQDRVFPSIEDLDADALPDFGPYSVLLDFSQGIQNPAVAYLGTSLAAECGADGVIRSLQDVPSRSLLSRITDHYMQILANQAPIGFEAEFVNQRQATILYRGILLPFSSDDDTIDFIYGVINWKELADQRATDELMLEIDQALEAPLGRSEDPLTEWADGPAEPSPADPSPAVTGDVLDLPVGAVIEPDGAPWPRPAFGEAEAAELPEVEFDPPHEPDDMGLADWLDSARELARAAQGSEDRTRQALYAAIGRAYDFSLAAAANPSEFTELVSESGLTIQDRAPLTPVVKLVFGADYDKTRLTEYAAALAHAQRLALPRGALTEFLARAPGGLKGVVNEERRLRRLDAGKTEPAGDTPREALARKLRKIDYRPLAELPAEGSEFTVLVARRLPGGEVVLLGEVANDMALLERAARRLLD